MLLKAPKNREAWSTHYLEWEILEHYPHLKKCSAKSYYTAAEAMHLLNMPYNTFMSMLEKTHYFYGVVLSNGKIMVHPHAINKMIKERGIRNARKLVKGLVGSLKNLEKLSFPS